MKKLMQRFFGIAVSAAMLFTSGMTAFAAGHNHHDKDKNIVSPPDGYTITLTTPSGYITDTNKDSKKFGAYQIFTGTVKGGTIPDNPGDTYEEIPITDIKWGNAFGATDEESKKNIIKFVFALAEAPTGYYKYAFSEFKGFEGFVTADGKLSTEYLIDTSKEVTVTKGTTNAIGKGSDVGANWDNVKFDKLAVAVADVIASNHQNREWLQSLTDILGGYGDGYNEGNFVSQCYGKDNTLASSSDGTYKYEIKVPAGYYMIMDLSTIEPGAESDDSDAYSARMLFVANDIRQEIKESVPTLDKKVLREGTGVGENGNETDVAGVGDVVHFQLKGTLPSNYDNYLGGYQYKFIDTLSNGLDLVKYADDYADYVDNANDCVKVTVKGLFEWDKTGKKWTWDGTASEVIPLVASGDRTDLGSADGTHLKESANNYTATYVSADRKLTVEFPCLREIRIQGTDDAIYRLGYNSDTQFSEIFLDYYAKVNSNAVVSPADDGTGEINRNGNFNTAQIQYSDNPQSYGDTDYTTTDRATVYTFGLDIVKIDAADFLKNDGKKEDAALKDVPFMLARPVATTLDSNGKTKDDTEWEVATLTLITSTEIASMNPQPTVESFKENGYYSIVSWTKVDGTDKKGATFDPSWVTDAKEVVDDTNGVIIKTVDKGVLNISGLDVEVLYSLAEVDVPQTDPKGETAGYAKIAPFTFKLHAQMNTEETEYTGKLSNAESEEAITSGESFTFAKPVQFETSDTDGSAKTLVANFKYTDLPSTGGVGTVWFYILGAGGVGLAGVLFFLSKKKVTK